MKFTFLYGPEMPNLDTRFIIVLLQSGKYNQ